MKYFLKIAEFAPGIPDKKTKTIIPTLKDKEWEFAIQKHKANKAGLHYDLRLGDPETQKAFSWAIRYLPKPGEKRLAIRQPDHTLKYMDFSGEIPEGYGAGKVDLKARGKTKVKKITDKKIDFEADGKNYSLIKTNKDQWLIINKKPLDKFK